MKSNLLASFAAGVCGLITCGGLQAHDFIGNTELNAGYSEVIDMNVNHGCKGSPVKAVRVKIPEGVTGVALYNTRDWKVETKLRKLDKPIPGEGGRLITETVDEIMWKDPASPMPASGVFETFKFRASLPDSPGKVLFFPTITVCEQGDDKYVDLPKQELRAEMLDFGKKLGEFMYATPGPSPFVVLKKPTRPQRPWIVPAQAGEPAAAKSAAKKE